ncbi:MAG: DUF3800 domain-containing protein [Candidatus Diapherotrites archaeon]|nr:DUF3800 domain-containing protein [Candidatus Diapherotrites archaeon]
MFFLYLDESGNSKIYDMWWKKEYDFFVLGGIIIKEEHLNDYIARFREFKKQNFPESLIDVPIHSVDLNNIKEISGGKNSRKNPYVGILTRQQGKDILQKFYDFLASLEINVIAVVIDNIEHRKQYRTPLNPYPFAYMVLLERFEGFIKIKNEEQNSFGCVNLSESSLRLAKELTQAHEHFVDKGTDYDKINHVFRQLNIDKSHKSTFFDFADAVCYAYQKLYSQWLRQNYGEKFQSEKYLLKLKSKMVGVGRFNIDDFRIILFPKPRIFDKN